ncbi:MAG: Eco57I restriction-modification methylase domain-containing protein, partial [Methanosarcinales archaeon]
QGNRVFKKLKQSKLDLDKPKSQILKYLQKGREYIILTNIKEWYFFNKTCAPDEFNYFHFTDLFDFLEEYEVQENLFDYLERKEFESIRGDLDKRFFQSLNAWVKKLSEVDFTVDGNKKTELIIGLLNKFIFVQTLEDYGVINFQGLKTKWEAKQRDWISKGKERVLKEFFREVDTWFYEYYDTELFREDILKYINNIDLFYRNLQLVLGLTYWQTSLGGFKGILQYNFKYIEEDIFGKAYETFLAELRKEKGIYYTPSYITEYIVENTVGKIFEEMVIKIKKELEFENFESAKYLIHKFLALKVLDPACGSGSFLIKALRLIFKKYKEILDAILSKEKEYSKFNNTLTRAKEEEEKVKHILELKQIITFQPIELISKIIIRHIYGNDLDKKALEVAKVNLWLSGIKLYPKGFRFDRLPENTNPILPDLEMNLCKGDSLVGLPEDFTINYLHNRHNKEIIKLFELRNKYLENPNNPELVEEIKKIKNGLRKELDLEFKKYLEENKLSFDIIKETKPLHWALEFWYVFFKENGEALSVQERGFDAVVGNPPYISVKRGIPKEIDSFLKEHYHSAKKQYDEYCTFMERAIDLSRFNASISYIVPIPMLSNENMLPIREYILKNCLIKNLADFGFVFEDADVESAVFVFEKKHYVPKGSHRFLFEQRKENEKINAWFVDQKSFLELPNLMFNISLSIEVSDLLNKIEKEANPLEFYFSITRGIEAGKDSISFSKDSKLHVPTLRGEDVRKYEISYQNTYTLFDETNTTKFKDKRIYKTKEKLLVRRVSSNLISTVDKSQFFNLNTLYNLINDKESIDMKYSCALLNSNLLNFWFKNKYVFNEKLFPYIRISQLNTVPIYPATPDQQKPIIELVDKIINLK